MPRPPTAAGNVTVISQDVLVPSEYSKFTDALIKICGRRFCSTTHYDKGTIDFYPEPRYFEPKASSDLRFTITMDPPYWPNGPKEALKKLNESKELFDEFILKRTNLLSCHNTKTAAALYCQAAAPPTHDNLAANAAKALLPSGGPQAKPLTSDPSKTPCVTIANESKL